ncbi:MAG: ZIP family metal transporter [Pyrinomonadaceae bacterium]
MKFTFIQLLFFGLIVALANVLGGMILFPSGVYKHYKKLLKYLLALGAGFMLAVTFIEIIPKTIDIWLTTPNLEGGGDKFYIPMILILGGYLLTQFFEHTIAPHMHLGEEIHADHLISTKTAYAAIGGLLIHTFFDGVSISAAAQVDANVGILMFVAVFLHKFPEGFTIASMILATGKGFKEVLIATSLVGFTTLLGVLGFYFIGINIESSVAYALPVAAGVTLYVAASDLIPEVNHHGGKNPLVSFSVFAGVLLFFAMHLLLHSFIEG